MPLTDAALKKAKPGTKAIRKFDGAGLYIEIAPNGGKWWRFKYRFAGKEKRISLGVYPEISLKEARDKRDEARRSLREGIDPSEARQSERRQRQLNAGNSFAAIAREWIEHQSERWEPITRDRILAQFEADVFPALGSKPIAELKARDVIAAVKAIEARGAGEMAARALQRIRSVFRYAIVHERIETNPMLDVKLGEVLRPRQTQHRPALAERELPAFLAKLDAYDGDPTTQHALRLLLLTATRPGELRGARWNEINIASTTWRIPAERMKMRAEHVVPLSRQAVAVLESIRPLTGGDELVFPSPFYPGRALSENTLNSALARMGYKGIATAHGFRALFSTVANECGHDPDHIERQLAHVERNQVRAAYHRAAYLKERAALMQWWSDYLDAKRSGNVFQGRFGKSAA